MKKFFLAAAIVLIGTSSLAQQIGPASTLARHHEPNFGLGYTDHEAEIVGVDVEQTRVYLHVGMGIGYPEEPQMEIYLRLGGADLETENLSGSSNFNGDFEPFVGAGFKANFVRRELPLGIGIVAQGARFAKWEDEVDGITVEVEEFWEFEGAIPVEYEFLNFTVYGGPVLSYVKGDVDPAGDVEDGDSFGVFGGASYSFGRWGLQAEVQDKTGTSLSGLLTYSF
ncbi:MAG: hypothetical protein GWN87_04035 [Desulfuromonadales bacterium]|nr:hypothetical protein [Desulfuromonadales bacterium]NIS39793.1 hypothetical protein [Desulfuromonadales bacterium]